jgi:hypothetical protein
VSDIDIRVRLREARDAVRDSERVRRGIDRIGDTAVSAGRRASRGLDAIGRGLHGIRGMAPGIGAGLATVTAAAAGGFYALGRGSKFAVDAAVDLGEQISKNTVVFRGSEREVLAWSKGTAASLGIARSEALEAAGVFGNMLVPMGLARGRAADMSRRMVGLAADLASFNNADPSETLEALRSGLAGETEPLRRFGVFLNDARVRQEAVRLGVAKSTKDVSAAAKAQATYSLILKDTKDAQGDFSRTSSSLANRQRQLKALWKDMAAGAGRLALPALQKLSGAAATFLGQIQSGKGAGGRFASKVRGVASAAKRGASGFLAGVRGQNAAKGGGDAAQLGMKVGAAMKFAAGAAVNAGRQLLDAFKPAEPFLRNVLLPLLKGFAAGLAVGLVGAFHIARGAIKVFATVLGWLGEKAAPLRGVLTGIGAVVGFLATGPFLKAFTMSAKLAAGASRIGQAFTKAGGLVKTAMGGALKFVSGLGSRFAGAGRAIVGKLLGGIKTAFANGVGFAAGIGDSFRNWLNDHTPLGDEVKAGPLHFRLPALRNGGDVAHSGRVLVGEAGPEILELPKAARVTPLPHGAPLPALGAGGDVVVHTTVTLDGREIAHAVGRHTRDRMARR